MCPLGNILMAWCQCQALAGRTVNISTALPIPSSSSSSSTSSPPVAAAAAAASLPPLLAARPIATVLHTQNGHRIWSLAYCLHIVFVLNNLLNAVVVVHLMAHRFFVLLLFRDRQRHVCSALIVAMPSHGISAGIWGPMVLALLNISCQYLNVYVCWCVCVCQWCWKQAAGV